MRYQDQLVRSTQKAMEDVVRAAQAVPADHQDWSPMGSARSALSQMQEIATSADFFLPIFRDGVVPEFSEHARNEAIRIRRSHDTMEKCIEATRRSVAELCAEISAFPDDRLEEEIALPFGGGILMTMADLLALPSWNMVYHLGQINQLQLMLGDRDMH
jgi:uncharacterized damage-inducible protein DinB